MKSKILISVFFILTTFFSFSQVPTQQWLTVINDSTSTNDLFSTNTGLSKFPFELNNSNTKIGFSFNSGSNPSVSLLNVSNGDLLFNNVSNTSSINKDFTFDELDNIYTISNNNTSAYLSKINSLGITTNTTTITGGCDENNLLTCNMGKDQLYVYNRQRDCGKFNTHILYSYDSTLNQNWLAKSTEIDWYYGYDGRMIVDSEDNIIIFSKKQTSKSLINSYDIVLRKFNSSGKLIWQTNYDYNSKMDIIAGSYSISVDSNNDIFFISTNSSNWSNMTLRVVKLNGQNGSIIFQNQLPQTTSGLGELIITQNKLFVSNYDRIHCLNSSNGNLEWTQNISNIQYISKNENGGIFATTTNGVIALDTLGNTLYNLNVTIPGYTVKHLHTISDNLGRVYVVGYRINNNINKVFIAKFACSVSVDAGQDLTVCQGDSVNLSATSSPNSTMSWSDGYQNGQNIIVNSTQTFTVNASLNGCNSSDQITINVIPYQNVDAGQDLTVCQGESVTLNASGGSSYNWSDSVQDGLTFIPQSTHTYFVSGTGCSKVDSVTVTVNQNPSLANGSDVSTCRGTFINLDGQNYFTQSGLTFNWSNNIQNGVDFQPTQTNTYVVTATTPSGCFNTDSVIVTVNYASDTVIKSTACDSYTLNGQTYNESGHYTQYLTNSTGCDSVVVLNLSINHLPSKPVLSVEDDKITTPLQLGVDFIWVRCPNNTPVNSEVGLVRVNDAVGILTPYFSGSYSVIATNGCGSVQSDCQTIEINTANIEENVIELNVYPNPTQDFIQIDGLQNVSDFQLFDSNGKLVLSGEVNNKEMIDLLSLNKGTYQLVVSGKILRIVRI